MADKNGSSANLGFEDKLWMAADALRSNMDAAEYKHVVLGLIFLKYISDAFEERYALLEAEATQDANFEDPDEYLAENIFWVPKETRWAYLLASARQPTIGKTVDNAMLAIERDNPSLKGVLPKDYAHPRLDKQRLGQLIDLIGNIGLGDKANRSKDILAMDTVFDPLIRRRVACNMESRTLAALRDTLLPKLISGELRVSDARQLSEVP